MSNIDTSCEICNGAGWTWAGPCYSCDPEGSKKYESRKTDMNDPKDNPHIGSDLDEATKTAQKTLDPNDRRHKEQAKHHRDRQADDDCCPVQVKQKDGTYKACNEPLKVFFEPTATPSVELPSIELVETAETTQKALGSDEATGSIASASGTASTAEGPVASASGAPSTAEGSMASATAPSTVACPECAATLTLANDTVLSEMLQCSDCGIELEVMALDPPRVDLVPDEEEDWGE